MAVIIKGKLLDKSNPKICVPVMGENITEILSQSKKLIENGVEMIEWRADYFTELFDREKVREVLEKLREITTDTILVVTVRSKDQGGKCTMPEEERKSLLIEMSQAHSADLIDVEYFSYENPARLVERLHERGALVILSHHDFIETPGRDVMRTLLGGMTTIDPDIVKLAVMPNSMQDVSNLLSVTDLFCEAYPGIPIITMSMGELGVISRIGGFVFGSCVTFASDGDAASAPVQLPYDDLEVIINILK